MKWFYIDESITSGDRRVGPVETDELKTLKADGKIKDTTLVAPRHEGMGALEHRVPDI